MCRKRFFFMCVLMICSSFFWEDDEKQVKQLHQAAEAAMTSKRFEEAIESYEALLKRIDPLSSQKNRIDSRTYADTILRLCSAYEALGKFENADKELAKALMLRLPDEFLGRLKLAKARISTYKKPAKEAYLEMKSVIPLYAKNAWRKEELSFFHALESSLNSHYESLYQRAKINQAGGVYEEAISSYKEILDASEKGYYPKAGQNDFILKKIRFHLAECYFGQANFEMSLSLCKEGAALDKIEMEMIYLSALCYKEKKEYEKALELFQQYFKSADKAHLDHFDHALFEIGHFYYRNKNYAKAKKHFELLRNEDAKSKRPSLLAGIYLAKIHVNENSFKEADDLLSSMSKEIQLSDPLRFEWNYLRGQAAYQIGDYPAAKSYFEAAIPQGKNWGDWTKFAHYYLGLSYLKLGDDFQKQIKLRQHFFSKAEEIFEKLSKNGNWEEPCLALARLYLLKESHLNEKSLEKIDTILSKNSERFSLHGRFDALLLRAESAPTFEEKEAYYKKATDSIYSSLSSYSESWTLRGLNLFQEGLKNPHQMIFFDEATLCFENAFKKIEKKDGLQAAKLLKLEAKAHFYKDSLLSSLILLEKLLNQFQETIQEREETWYLRGLIAAKLSDFSYHRLAEESFSHIVREYPSGKFADHALHMLGALYYKQGDFEKAQKTFIRLVNEYPNSLLAAEGCFWTAEILEKLHLDPAPYRMRIYEKYPQSNRAEEAFFRLYTYDRYLEGDHRAIHHLKEFTKKFPSSSLLVAVHYLIGIHEESFEESEKHLEKALNAFQFCMRESKFYETPLIYFHYRAKLELSELYLKHMKQLEKATAMLLSIIEDFADPHQPFTSLLRQKSSYPPLYEESEYMLALLFLKCGKSAKAQECFSAMLAHYQNAGIEKGYYLAHVWKEQGKLAMRCNDHDTALKCFEIALECGADYLSDDQTLSVWISQSLCHKEKAEYDIAMRLLSRVINADVISPLRLKAMSLRAEIYELQGRPELAVRQLEAAARKGSSDAEEKLRLKYGL